MTDLRFAIRQLRKKPGFTAVAVLTLALCIGANLSIFAVVDGVLLRPLPFSEPDRLVTMFNSYPKADHVRAGSSYANLYSRRGSIDAFSSVAAFKNDAVIVGEAGSGERAEILRISANFLGTLGVLPQLGRGFTEEEMTFQTHHLVILSDRYWRRHFDADPDVVGRQVQVNGFAKTVVGVLPEDFQFLSSVPQILLPLSSPPDVRGINGLHETHCEMIARLAPGATLEQAQAQINAHNAVLNEDFPFAKQVTAAGFATVVRPLRADHVAAIRPTLLLLQSAGLFLLLIGMVNLVNLLLVRAGARTKELAIRQALGAGRLHVVRQVMLETLLLTFVGGATGLLVGAVGVKLLSVLGVEHLPMGTAISVNARLGVAALVGAVLLGLLVGVPVAWYNLRGRIDHTLKAETRGGTTGRTAQRMRHSFAAAQLALAFVLLAGSGLLWASLKRTMEVSPGFSPDQVLAGHISMIHRRYFEADVRVRFAEQVVEHVRRQPGVMTAGIVTRVPVAGSSGAEDKRVMTTVGDEVDRDGLPVAPYIYGITGDYFRAMGIPLRSGRFFDPTGSGRDEQVCIVDEAFARISWPGGEPVGQLVYDGPEVEEGEQPFRVVGVVGAVKPTNLTDESEFGAIYLPLADHRFPADNLHVVVRTAQMPEAIAPSLERVVREIEPELPLNDLRPMDTRISDTLVARRSPALLAGVFAVVALVLAAIGNYGVLSFAVSQRHREIGVRMALGARPKHVAAQFLGLGLRLLLTGVLLGCLAAWLTGRAMQGLLYNIPPLHLQTFMLAALALSVVALIACVIPAWRAARIDPMEALRSE